MEVFSSSRDAFFFFFFIVLTVLLVSALIFVRVKNHFCLHDWFSADTGVWMLIGILILSVAISFALSYYVYEHQLNIGECISDIGAAVGPILAIIFDSALCAVVATGVAMVLCMIAESLSNVQNDTVGAVPLIILIALLTIAVYFAGFKPIQMLLAEIAK